MSASTEFSVERGVRAATYLVFGCSALLLVATGGISAVLHPRMHPWIVCAGVLFLLLGANELARVRDALGSPMPVRCYYALLLVIVIGILFPDVGKNSVGAIQIPTQFTAPGPAPTRSNAVPAPRTPVQIGSGPIAPNDDQYWTVFNTLYDKPGDYSGRQITVAGFIYREQRFPEGVSMVSRNLIWCCTADKGLIGFLASGGDLSSLAEDTWVEVTGILDTTLFSISGNGSPIQVPFIHITSMRPLQTHPSENIFPL